MPSNSASDKVILFFAGDFPEGMSNNARLRQLSLGFRSWGLAPELNSLFPSHYRDHTIPSEGVWEGIPYRHLAGSAPYQHSGPWRLLQRLRGQWNALRRVAVTGGTSFLYFYNPRFSDSMPALLLARLLGRKVVVDQTERFSTLGHPVHRLEEWLIARLPQLLCLISNRLMDHYVHARVPRFHLPIMVDPSRFEREQDPRPFTVGYLGNFSFKDHLQGLVQGVARVRADFPQLRLILMGHDRGDQLDALRGDDGAWIEYVDRPSHAQIPALLKRCDCLLINRPDQPFSYYGYPYKLGEYLASGRPVLVSAIDGFAAEYEDGEYLAKFRPDDPQDLARALRIRYAEPDTYRAMAERARTMAIDRFTSEIHIRRLGDQLRRMGWALP